MIDPFLPKFGGEGCCVMIYKAFFQKILLWIPVLFVLLVGIFVYATVDRTEIVSEQLVIIPESIKSNSWKGVELTLGQDISSESLYQNFSPANSAYIDTTVIEELNNAISTSSDNSSVQSQNNDIGGIVIPLNNASETYNVNVIPETNVDNNSTSTVVDSVNIKTEGGEVDAGTVESATPVSDNSSNENQPVQDTTNVEPQAAPVNESSINYKSGDVVWGVFAKREDSYPLLQETITTDVTTTSGVNENIDEVNDSARIQNTEDNSDSLIVDNSDASSSVEVEETIQSSEEVSGETEAQTEIVESDEQTPDEEVYVPPPTVKEECNASFGCKTYDMIFSGFMMPEFETGKFITSAQLRLSLAGKTKLSEPDALQRFVVEYDYADGKGWQTATIIDIEDEISNSINGDYFLVSLEQPTNQTNIANLQVRVSYQGDVSKLERAYVEGVWLEVEASSFFEKPDPNDLSNQITYHRDLMEPKFHELNDSDLDVTLSSLPSFTLNYSPQQNFLKRVFKAIFNENTYKVDAVRVIDQNGIIVTVPVDFTYHDDKTWTIKFLEQPQKLVPGKYKIEVVVNENETLYTDTFEFYWGVLAVNTTKSMYFANEPVKLNLAALTDKGDTICDANLQLKVVDPENNIYEIPVEKSGHCGKNNVTDVPDYLANFDKTDKLGLYTIQLQHLNQQGEVVHNIRDSFEVRDYIPYDIERTAPTRIYPLAQYDVELNIKANRIYDGDIIERIPRGFVVDDSEGMEIVTLPEYTELIWRNIKLEEGQKIELSYRFDAPDVSPYMYLLGPLNMDGFTELRQWQIASDALTAIGWFTGTRTVAGTNLNATPSPLQWSTSTIDSYYFTHSTSTDSHKITFKQNGDYMLSVNLPQHRTDANNSRTRVGVEVRVNGTAVPEGLGRSAYIRGFSNHTESSSNSSFLLKDISVNDYVEVYAEGLTTIDAGDIVNVTGQAGLLLEYMPNTRDVFSATSTQTTNSTNLNQTTAYAMKWVETRQDSGFTHSDSVNPENIIIANAGTYMVTVNVPLTGDTARQSVLGRVKLDGIQVSGGIFAQGYTQNSATESDGDSSIHWSGIVVATTTNQVLTITTEREAAAGTSTVTTGFVGTIFMEKLPTTDLIALRGTALVSGADWNTAATSSVQWTARDAYDSTVFTHSTSTNSHQITILEAGSYELMYNDAMTSSVQRANNRIQVQVNGVSITGVQTKSHYLRNQSGHNNSSASLVYMLNNLNVNDVVTVTSVIEANNGAINSTTSAMLMLWQKTQLNERPQSPVLYDVPFNNIRFASTTPYFDFSALDPDGSSDIQYQFSISTSSSFTASTTKISGTDSGFSNTASSTDTSPFLESNKIRFQLQPANALTDLQTYYWRVRARDTSGSNEYGEWSTTQSLTVDMSAQAPNWYQTYSDQFDGDSLVGTVSNAQDKVQVDAAESTEMLIVYGEGTNTSPRYRLWNGSAWGVEGSAQAVSNTINWVKTASGVARDEYALVTLDQSNDAYVQIYNASSSSWGNQKLLSSVVASNAYRGIAVAYESLSGDAMAVSCDNGPDPVYSIWNGTSWSATTTINASSLNNCNFLDIASDPDSDSIILVVRDTGTQYEAFAWDGSTWVDSRVLGSSASQPSEAMSVQYESSGDQAVVAVGNGINNSIVYTVWDGTAFSPNTTQAIGNDFLFARMVTDPDTDKMLLCYVDASADVGILEWDGGAWNPFQEIELTANGTTGRPVDCTYESVAGRTDYHMSVYSDTTDTRYRYGTTTTSWSPEATVSTISDSFWVQTERADNGVVVAVTLDDTSDDLESSYWNGTGWSTKDTIETNPSSVIVTPYEMFDMTSKRFQFSEGKVTSPVIDFDWVPNQLTWGDITFSTTEPLGTDVRVSVLYSSSTACDTLVPNAVLPGNSTGFDVGNVPIDLTSLSTSTYNQICLRSTITTLGSASASLDDWTLSWLREPKLVQSNYRWYVNGSFLTPTDPWPLGVSDLSENTALSSINAINSSSSIRLRMSLMGNNVTLPTSTKAFKLQYAEGGNCSISLAWHDVGSPASTTAIWRGHQNSIVGSDWLSGSWGKRIKINIESDVVDDDVTNFPVYIDLADLPSNFFQNVKSDGGDIRITKDDGTSEVPFEIVTIDTGAKTGELHFKADLSSTTDKSYFIYYSNPSASGYSASATYGSRNVWTNGYSLRYQMGNNPAGSSPQFRDSTSNSNHAVARAGMTSGDVVTGKIGSAIDLDGNDGGVFQNALAYTGEFTASMWWYSSSTGFAIAGPAGANEKFGPWNSPAGKIFARVVSSSDTAVNSPANNVWNYVVISRDASNKVDLYINGTTTRLFGNVAQTGTSDWENFGGETTQGFIGRIDELRFANTKRSNGWMSTEFNNQSNPTGFYDILDEELISDNRNLPSVLLGNSDYPETYEEENPTKKNRNAIPVNQESEWDFSLQNHLANNNTSYCFRMVYEDGSVFRSYDNYPKLITNASPLTPSLYTPFDNERLASTTPWFEFAATDELGDNITYQIQVSTDINFGSTVIDNNSVTNFALFENLLNGAEKSEFTSGQRIRYIPSTNLTNGNTYWWRVRGQDASGSGTYSQWSVPTSFTVNTANTISTWFQTTGDQFSTDNLQDAVNSTSTNDVGIESGFTVATTTSSVIDFDNGTIGNAWGALSFSHNVTSGSIRYYIEYRTTGGSFVLVPDSVLAGNSSGFTTSPVSLSNLKPETYNEIRIVSVLSGNSTLPRLQDWTVEWDRTIEVPTLIQYFDNAKAGTTTPTFTFTTTDPESDDIEYQLQISSSYLFTSSSTYTSGVSAGFLNTVSATDTSPFLSGNTISYTAQTALTNGNTYWWRVRAKDPSGDNVWSDYSKQRSFTVDTSITVSTWHQTSGEQFDTNTLNDIETTSGAARITTTVNEVLMAYGEGTNQAPRYRKWNGTSWSTAASGESVGAQIRWTDLEASPTRPEYALGTVGTDADMNVQIYNTDTDIWGNVKELETNVPNTLQRGFDTVYEMSSGDLMAVSCSGNDAVYSIWNGTSWSATSSITLANTNNCTYIELASDPTSDEIVAVFKHAFAGTIDYELMVWSGTAWGNALAIGVRDEDANAGAAAVYEESGNQAIVALSNGAATSLLYATWSGSAWATSTYAIGDHIEWASLKADVGSDEVLLCYVDNDTNIGVAKWSGSNWTSFSEIEQIAKTKAGQPIDCEFETTSGRDGYIMAAYSDATNGRYQTAATTTFGGEQTLDTILDSWRVITVRAGDGLIHTVFFDDTNDRYETSQWNGTNWTARQTISSSPSITGTPFDGSLAMAARIYPNFTSGSVRSTPIDFNDGNGPRWEAITWNDTTPGTSHIDYRLYYLSSTSQYVLVPDSALAGNSSGFTTSPVNISDLDRTIYETLALDADFICVSGNCPTLEDWSLAWSEGLTVSGTAYEYDAATTINSGTVAVAVNGVIQSGKTATIAGDGTWSIPNVTIFEGDIVTVFVSGATDANEAVAITKYDGIGNVTGLQLARRNLSLGSNDSPTLLNSDLNYYDNSNSEDLFFNLDGSNILNLCVESGCSNAKLRVLAGTTYQPGANGSVINFENYGTFVPATSTLRVGGNWLQNGTFTVGASTIIFTATTSSLTLQSSTSSIAFNNVTFGETSGSATWTPNKAIVTSGSLIANYGTLVRGTSTLTIAGNLQLGASGYITGLATTTFNGSGSNTWSDAKTSTTSTNVGYVVIDGTAKTITLGGNVAAQSVTIGSDDTFNASGSGYNINVYGDWTNNNSFIPQTGTVTFTGTSSATINRGTSSFNNLTFSGVGGVWSFSTSTLVVGGNLSIATGTVTLPTGTTTVAGSFLNTGGTFVHNNGEVRMTSTSAGRSITQSATAFLNAFYDLVFAGTGSWNFTESSATTTRNLRIQSGTVTFPSTNLTVGGNLLTTGSGAFLHNNGQVTMLVQGTDSVSTNGSSFNNVLIKGGVSSSWYNDNWLYRVPITINESQVDADLVDFPVYVDLDNLPSHFFSNVKSNGGDIRVTAGDGMTELPVEVVSINTAGTEGELYFKAASVSGSVNTTFYIYYGNSGANAYAQNDTYGENNVWNSGYVLVEHMDDLTTSSVENSKASPDGTKSSANNPVVATNGKLYQAQDFSGDSIGHTDVLGSQNQMSFSAWVNADDLIGSGETATYGYTIFGISPTGAPYTWLTAGGTGFTDEFRFCAYSNSTTCTGTVNADIVTGAWYHISVTAVDGASTTVRVNGVERASFNNPGDGTLGTNFTLGDLRPGRNINFDGKIDDVRVSNVIRSNAWRDAEYRNTATSTSFYTVNGYELPESRTFTNTNVTILGNLNLDSGGDAIFPTGILSIGGSFANNATFNANNGTVRFNSTAGSETINAGNSAFSSLDFNSASGDFTITENATATGAVTLANVQQFTLSNAKTLAVSGSFSHTANGANTTWVGSTLRLLNGGTVNLNSKTHGGDVYGTLESASSTLVKMWNSSASNYVTSGTTGAIYSQDHAGADGDLNIYGNYTRITGTEYWSAATDFDGTALTGINRQVDVRVASSSNINFTNASLAMIGTSTASSTIAAISGSYSLTTNNTTLNNQYFTINDIGTNGLNLTSSSTLALFSDGYINVAPNRTGITIDASTVDKNPAKQLNKIGFATTSVGSASNVTLSGGPSSFVWFRDGLGGLYGEAFDANDANPGSIRFDDSAFLVTVSGTVYSDAGISPLGAPTCDGSTLNVKIVVDGGSYASSTSCNAGTGAYTFTNVSYVGDPNVIVYLDTNGGERGSVVTKTLTGNVTNMDIYTNRLIVRHEDVTALSIADMVDYDYDNDSDIAFTATLGTPNTLVTAFNTELYVKASSTFTPGGNITLGGNGNNNSYEGTLVLATSSSFISQGNESHNIAGRFVAGSGANFVAASSTFTFTATTTGKSITTVATTTFNNLTFAGTGGGWNIGGNLNVLGDIQVASGTVTGTGNVTLSNGSLSGNGVLSMGGGTVKLDRTNTLGGTTAWTFNNLVLGNGTSVGTTTPAGLATTTILGQLTISNAHFLDANNSNWDLAGNGNVLVENGTLLEDTSSIRYSGTTANVLGTNYYNLNLNSGAGLATYTGVGSGILVLNDLTVGGSASSTFNTNTSDPVLEVRGNLLITGNSTLEASNSTNLTVLGNWTNNGTFIHNNGTVRFTGTGTTNINAGNSSFFTVLVNGTGNFVVTNNATATTAWRLQNHNNFTVNSGQTLAVAGQFENGLGGTNTTWTGSTLSLSGNGTYLINSATTSDSYGTLAVGTNSQIRMWNSDASTYAVSSNGSLYSQDHAGVNGNLYIFGQLNRTSGSDYWSYATDFDGANLSGVERAVNVYFANGASATWSNASLSIIGAVGATTTIQNQGSGTYGLTLGSSASTSWNRVQVRDINSNGVVFTGTPVVNDFSYTDHLVAINNASAITVGGTAIDANQAKNFTSNKFEAGIGVTGAINVKATGTSVSSWRFTNHFGNIAGEGFDSDPAGDPGYVVFDDSAALITISGNVYSDEGSTVSTVCDGTTPNVRLVVAGLTTYDTNCNASTGAYSISNVAFSSSDTLTLYINNETEKAANVSMSPISSISNMHLYEKRVIVRHENTNPITIDNMVVWDSSDDADIPFTAVNGSPDTLTLPSNTKLLVWAGKTFEPNGNVTLSGGGSGGAEDGTLEVQSSARLRAKNNEAYSVGGSLIFGNSAEFISASSTFTLNTNGAARTIDVNDYSFHNLTLSGTGSWNVNGSIMTINGSYVQSNGSITFPTGTTTVGNAFNVTGGSFNINGSPIVLTGTGVGTTLRFNGSLVNNLTFLGTGSYNMTDTNATATGNFILNSGSVSLPNGSLTIGRSLINNGGAITHNTSDLIMTSTSTATLQASSSDLFSVLFAGAGTFNITDQNVTFLESFNVGSGTVIMATGTTAIGGSLLATGGNLAHSSGTILLNSTTTGRTVNVGNNTLYNLQIGAPAGGYTFQSATTSNNFIITNVGNFTLQSGSSLAVGGVFTNAVGGASTTWTGSTLLLNGSSPYSINSRTNNGDVYGTLTVGQNANIRAWYSSAATTTVASSGSLYSQDHANINGRLYIYGNFNISTTTEYWNYATDFDGTNLFGTERQVNVYLASGATTTVNSGTLQIIGGAGNVTNIQSQASSTYSLQVRGGTFNSNHYAFYDLDINGLQLLNNTTIANLSDGYYDLEVNNGSFITLSSTTLNSNPSMIFDNVGFHATGSLSGYNVNLVGSTSNAWRFTNNYGNIGGEGFDIDGLDACGSIRFDNSACLITEQTHYRWRNDNGGEGGALSEWLSDTTFDLRKRIRVSNNDNLTYSSTSVKVVVSYDSDMKSDFSDLRFTAENGVTPIPFWVEKYTASSEANVWVLVPSLPASGQAIIQMYYGSTTASSLSNGANVFNAFDDYEDNNISEYSGDTSLFNTAGSPVYGGSYALKPTNTSGKTTDGIYRFDKTINQGEMIRYMQYVNTAGTSDEPCTLFGVQSPGSNNNNYAVCLELFGTDRISLSRNVSNNDSSGTVLASSTVTYSTGWYEVVIDWQTNDDIDVYLYNSAGTLVTSISANDTNYSSGGYGYSFWYQNGAWDSFTSRPRVNTLPTIYLGAEQAPNGATWLRPEDTAGEVNINESIRLRLAIENSGLNISNQEFQLEFAPKGAAPSCGSVSGASFGVVPNQASCGSSAICMATSTYVVDDESTSDHLAGTTGEYSIGRIVENPSNKTSVLGINQNYYTELEYVLKATNNASDSYCFRVTNAGDELDFYAEVPELNLEFSPVFGAVNLNNGLDISLTPGTTTLIYATATVTDMNGYADLAHATATIYRSALGPGCSVNNNNCYQLSTASNTCSFTNCSGNSCTLSCSANIFFHADATDADTYEGQEWLAFLEVEDQADRYAFGSAPGVEMLSIRAMDVDSLINYGALQVESNTGSFNPTTTITNLGNTPIDVDVEATDLTDGLSSLIPANQQKVATSTFTYNTCVGCLQLSSSTPVTIDVNLSKPTVANPPTGTQVYWGIAVPFGTSNSTHSGLNTFTAIGI